MPILRKIIFACMLVSVYQQIIVEQSDAQSLIQKLPRDGTWATYTLKGTTPVSKEKTLEYSGELTIRCVGTEYEQMEPLRWIEIETNILLNNHPMIVTKKFLVPENQIGPDKNPSEHICKMWQEITDGIVGNAESVEPNSTQAKSSLSYYLPAPEFNKQKELPSQDIAVGLNSYNCKGHFASVSEVLETGDKFEYEFTSFANDQSPFGTVALTKVINKFEGKQSRLYNSNRLVLKEFGMGAQSRLPDKK